LFIKYTFFGQILTAYSNISSPLWVPCFTPPGTHATLYTYFAAIYFLFPILTNGAKLYSQKLANFHFWAQLTGGIGMGAFMGMAGLNGMLRRSLYVNGEFNSYMILAALCGALLLFGFLAFFFNIVMSVGLNGVIGIFLPSKLNQKDLLPKDY
jgi:cytochrome c oxidase subunit 1